MELLIVRHAIAWERDAKRWPDDGERPLSAPGVTRAFQAGPDGLELLAFGPRHDGDGDVLPGWWSD